MRPRHDVGYRKTRRMLRRLKVPNVGQCGYLQPQGTVAAELLGSSASRLHQSSLRRLGLLSMEKLPVLNPPNRRGTDPYAVVWEERIVRCPLSRLTERDGLPFAWRSA